MVKYNHKKEDCELSTSQSICCDSEVSPSETLIHIIDQMPKLTAQERKQAIRLSHCLKNNSRKWSLT